MTTLKRLSSYLLVFAILLIGFVATGFWQYLDYFVYRTLYLDATRQIQVADNLLLIDLPYRSNDSDNDPTEYRLRLADLLRAIAGRERERPQAVILDIWISNDGRGLPDLAEAITRLRERREGPVDVYASFNPDADGRQTAEQLWKEHAQDLYRSVLTGYGHTSLNLSMGVLSYKPELQIPSAAGTTELIWALPTKVGIDLGRLDPQPNGEAVVLPVGSEGELGRQTVSFVHAGRTTSNGAFFTSRAATAPTVPPLDKKIVLVGSVTEDRYKDAPQAGPNLIAWAINDQLTREGHARRPLNNPALVLGQTLFFAVFTVLVFALLFKFLRRLQTKPALMACLSVGISVAALAMVGAAALTLKYVAPVGLTLFAIVLAGILAWRFALKFLMTGVAEGSAKYDAFISYSRKHSEWVVKNVYEPLKAMRKADGSELAVFFDCAEIGLGEAFTAKYMWAIVDSRCFIPIFSDDYYARNHTRNEMDVAYKRSVEKKIVILPVAHTAQPVPEIYSHLNFVDAKANPLFIEEILKGLLGALAIDQHSPDSAAGRDRGVPQGTS
jgi:TIR domain